MNVIGLRVAQVVVSDAFAGTERYAANLATGLAAAGAEVFVVGGAREPCRNALAGTGATFLPAATVLQASGQLRRLGHLDLVHAHLTAAELAATLAFPRRSRTAVVCTRHIAARRGSSIPGRAVAPLVRARLEGQLAPSHYVAARVDGDCCVIPTGVPDAELGAHDERVVLVAQRLEAEKDTATALRAWSASGLGEKGWELHVAGTGSEERRLRGLVGKAGTAASVRFLGHVDDLQGRFARAALLLATAVAEPFGLSVVEAMACGLPVIAAAAGGHLETVGQVEGAALFEPGDHISAGTALCSLAEDDRWRTAYGQRLQERQRAQYSLGNFVECVAAWYKDVLDRAPRTGTLKAPGAQRAGL